MKAVEIKNVTMRNFNPDLVINELSKEEVLQEKLDINTRVMYASMLPIQDVIESENSRRSASQENPKLKNAELTG